MQANETYSPLTTVSMRLFYFVVLWFSSLLLADSGVITLFDIGTRVYLSDLFFLFFFACFFTIAVRTRFRFYQLNRFYLLFIVVLFAALFRGFFQYGFSSIGEGRYVYWLWMFAVPLYFYKNGEVQTIRDFDKFFKITFCFVLLNVLLLLVIEVINGGRFFLMAANQEFSNLEDSRGVRYLGSEESFHLGTVLVYLVIDQFITKRKDRLKFFLMLLLLGIILFTKNRAAIISLVLGLGITLTLEGKGKIIIRLGFVAFLLLGLSFLLIPSVTESVLEPIIGAFNVTEDETGSWRLLIQAVAIEQGMQTPIFGQGFGGYFEYYVEQFGEVVNYPPHSMYIYIFQKTGIIGLLSYIAAIIALVRETTALKKLTIHLPTMEKYRLLLKVLLIAQIPYGFAYNFSLYLGFYVGMLVILRKISSKKMLQSNYQA